MAKTTQGACSQQTHQLLMLRTVQCSVYRAPFYSPHPPSLCRPPGHRRRSRPAGQRPLRHGQAEAASAGVPGRQAAQDLAEGVKVPTHPRKLRFEKVANDELMKFHGKS